MGCSPCLRTCTHTVEVILLVAERTEQRYSVLSWTASRSQLSTWALPPGSGNVCTGTHISSSRPFFSQIMRTSAGPGGTKTISTCTHPHFGSIGDGAEQKPPSQLLRGQVWLHPGPPLGQLAEFPTTGSVTSWQKFQASSGSCSSYFLRVEALQLEQEGQGQWVAWKQAQRSSLWEAHT